MKRLLGIALLLLAAGSVSAQELALGNVRVPVGDRTEQVRNQALVTGLEEVVTRLTGQKSVTDYPGLESLFDTPSRWVLQFGYEETPDDGSTPPDQAQPLLLAASFDVNALTARLAELGAPVWGVNRPSVLFWVVEQGTGAGQFVDAGGPAASRQALREQARHRGLPLILPRADGHGGLQPADVRGRFDQPVLDASGGYQTSLVVTAVLYQGNSPRLRWRLLQDGREEAQGEIQSGEDEQQMLAGLVDRVTDHLVGLYAVRSGAGESLSLRIHGVSSLPGWKQLQDFLTGVAGVEALQLVALQSDTVTFSARFTGAPTQFRRLVALNPHLEPCADDYSQAIAATEEQETGKPRLLEFCWRDDG